MNPIITVLAVLFSLATMGNTVWGTVRGKLYPQPVSWTLWWVIGMIVWSAAFADRLSSTLLYESIMLPCMAIVVFYAWKKSRPNDIRIVDLIAAGCCVAGIVIWQITDQPILAIVFALLADLFALTPTLRHIWIAPYEESMLSFSLSTVRNALFLINSISGHDSLSPLYLVIMDGATSLYIVFRRWQMKPKVE